MTAKDATEKAHSLSDDTEELKELKEEIPAKQNRLKKTYTRLKEASFLTSLFVLFLFAVIGFFAGQQIHTIILPPKIIVVPSPAPSHSPASTHPSPSPGKAVGGSGDSGNAGQGVGTSGGTSAGSGGSQGSGSSSSGGSSGGGTPEQPQPAAPILPPVVVPPTQGGSPGNAPVRVCLPKLPVLGRVGINCPK